MDLVSEKKIQKEHRRPKKRMNLIDIKKAQ